MTNATSGRQRAELLPSRGGDLQPSVLADEHDPPRAAVGDRADDNDATGDPLDGADAEVDVPAPHEADAKERRARLPVAKTVPYVEATREQPAGAVVLPLV